MTNPQPAHPAPPGFTVTAARYCRTCGNDVSDPGLTQCPRCLKPFDPADETTFRDTPKPEPESSWRNSDRLARVGLFALYLLGVLVLSGLTADYDTGNNHALGALALGLSVPWLIGCIYLALTALGDRLNPKLTATLPLATALGVVFALGSPALVLGAGFLLGPFTGLLFSWRNLG